MTNSANEAYWGTNTDVQNLGGAADFRAELPFARTPDWDWAMSTLLKGPTQNKPLLDLGAGLGVHTVQFARVGWTVIAADVSQARLVALESNMKAALGNGHKVSRVRCRAESLPFRTEQIGALSTKSVLIHVDLDRAATEFARILAPNAPFGFTEPLSGNPLVNLYRRTLAPKEWIGITRYFDPAGRELRFFEKHLGPLEENRFYLLSFLAFGFQFALRSPLLLKLALKLLALPDAAIRIMSPSLYRNLCWFTCLRGQRRGSAG